MKKIPVKIEKTSDGEWWVTSPEIFTLFAVGESRDEAISNAKEAVSLYLNLNEREFTLVESEFGDNI